MRMLTDVGKFLEKQALVSDLRECVALEYYEDSLGAALPLECLSAHKPDRGKCFSLSLPLQLPAELAAFLSKHPAESEQLKTDLKAMHVELASASAGDKLRAPAAHSLLYSYVQYMLSYSYYCTHCRSVQVDMGDARQGTSPLAHRVR